MLVRPRPIPRPTRRALRAAYLGLVLALGPVAAAGAAATHPASRPLSASDGASDAASASHGRVLKILSYNVRGLPILTDLDRLERIGEVLADRRRRGDEPDVVVLQEAFVARTRLLSERAGYPYVVRGPEDHGLFANASGLEVLSDLPIVDTHARTLNDCAFPDCLVSKSILGVEVAVPGAPGTIQVFTTHLQAQSRNESVRRNQIDDIAVFLRRVRFGRVPAIFAGDFNFKPRHPSYHKFLREVPEVSDAGYECMGDPAACEVDVGDDGRTDWNDVWRTTNDHQFYTQTSDGAVRIEPIRVIRNFTDRIRGGERGALSDHWGYEVHYRVTW